MYDVNCVTSYMIFTSPVANCHTFLYLLPALERDALYERPLAFC